MGRTLAAAGLLVLAAAAAGDPYESAKRKISLIEQDLAPPGARIWLSLKELNAYGAREALAQAPQGLREPRLELGNGSATGYAMVDFAKVWASQSASPNRLVSWFLSGERPVRVAVRIQSSGGEATVFLDAVTVSGIEARGALLDFLVKNFLLPRYPQAKIGEPFRLKHRIERFEVTSAGVTVFIFAPPRADGLSPSR